MISYLPINFLNAVKIVCADLAKEVRGFGYTRKGQPWLSYISQQDKICTIFLSRAISRKFCGEHAEVQQSKIVITSLGTGDQRIITLPTIDKVPFPLRLQKVNFPFEKWEVYAPIKKRINQFSQVVQVKLGCLSINEYSQKVVVNSGNGNVTPEFDSTEEAVNFLIRKSGYTWEELMKWELSLRLAKI